MTDDADDTYSIEDDPYNESVFIQGHTHSEPVCAWPHCHTFLTRAQMKVAQDLQAGRSPGTYHGRIRDVTYFGPSDQATGVDPHWAASEQTDYEKGIYGE